MWTHTLFRSRHSQTKHWNFIDKITYTDVMYVYCYQLQHSKCLYRLYTGSICGKQFLTGLTVYLASTIPVRTINLIWIKRYIIFSNIRQNAESLHQVDVWFFCMLIVLNINGKWMENVRQNFHHAGITFSSKLYKRYKCRYTITTLMFWKV